MHYVWETYIRKYSTSQFHLQRIMMKQSLVEYMYLELSILNYQYKHPTTYQHIVNVCQKWFSIRFHATDGIFIISINLWL